MNDKIKIPPIDEETKKALEVAGQYLIHCNDIMMIKYITEADFRKLNDYQKEVIMGFLVARIARIRNKFEGLELKNMPKTQEVLDKLIFGD